MEQIKCHQHCKGKPDKELSCNKRGISLTINVCKIF